MKLLISAPRFVPGKTYGAEVYFRNMLGGLLNTARHEDRIVVATNGAASDWLGRTFGTVKSLETETLAVPQGTVAGMFYERGAVPRTARKVGAEVIFFPFNLMPGAGFFGGRRAPSVLMVHDLVSHFYRAHFPGYRPMFNRLQAMLLGSSIGRAGAIVTPTQAIADELVAAFPAAAGKVTAIHEAAAAFSDGTVDAPLPDSWQTARHLIMQSGAKLPHKSQSTSIEALAILKREAPALYGDLKLVITGGDAADSGKLAEEIDAHGVQDAVDIAGRVPREVLGALATRATLHLFPTLYEGFGLGIVEALALGKSFVASDLPVLREVAGGQGFFFEPGNAAAMAATLQRALSGPLEPTRAPDWSWDDHGTALWKVLRSQAGRE